MYFVNVIAKEALWHEVPKILQSKAFYLSIVLIVFLLMLPFMAYRRFTRLIFSDNPY